MNRLFEKLRTEHPIFTYQSFDLKIKGNDILMQFHFIQSADIEFFPTIKLTLPKDKKYKNLQLAKLKNFAFNIGMIELISYWKAACSPKIVVKAGFLEKEQLNFWSDIYYNGLGEFIYLNKIETTKEDLFKIEVESSEKYQAQKYVLKDQNIIPIGGGKDSVVTIELLKSINKADYAFMLNPIPSAKECAIKAGFTESNTILVERKLDQKLLELNRCGYLNGHTPFSALLAFVASFCAVIYESKNIVLSNENSASEVNTVYNNQEINHQYSKSFGAELQMNQYIKKYLCEDLNYFSLLRPLYEIQIAKLFAHYEEYHPIFLSCNKGGRSNTWCKMCSKCLFVYLILSPFIYDEKLEKIFGNTILENSDLIETFKELLGITGVKPFDCVGTHNEVKIACALLLRSYIIRNKKLPLLLQIFKDNFEEEITSLTLEANRLLSSFNSQNILNIEQTELVKNSLKNIGLS